MLTAARLRQLNGNPFGPSQERPSYPSAHALQSIEVRCHTNNWSNYVS
jgi:hypothetical protein